MRLFWPILSLTFNSICVNAQWQYSISSDEPITCFDFYSSEYGIIGGASIYRTLDGGITWQDTVLIDGLSATQIDIASQNVIYLSAEEPTGIYKSSDSGKTWVYKYPLSGGEYIKDLDFINENNGFAVTNYSRVFKSLDGFSSAIPSEIVGPNPFINVYAKNIDTIYACSIEKVYRTADGGDTWQFIVLQPVPLIQFPLDSKGYAIFSSGSVYKTISGDTTWEELSISSLLDSIFFKCFYFINEDEGYLGGRSENGMGVIMKTTDGGDTWILTDIPGDVTDISKIKCFNDTCYALVAGEFGNKYSIIKTSNGGGVETDIHSNNDLPSEFLIFPNPVYNEINISISKNIDIKEIVTTNCLGEQINILWDENLTAKIYNLPAGIYITQILTGNIQYTVKWSKW